MSIAYTDTKSCQERGEDGEEEEHYLLALSPTKSEEVRRKLFSLHIVRDRWRAWVYQIEIGFLFCQSVSQGKV